jgi:hypothetical protein
MFDRLELMIKTVVERREEEDRQAAERQRRWEAAMAKARKQFAEQHRKNALRERIDEAREAEDIRAYAAALRSSAETVDLPRDDVIAWATWAQIYADEIGPVRNRAGTPATPEPGRDNLAPYLNGLSPWGPS